MTHARQAIDRICVDLGVWPGTTHTQDWAFEMPDAFRTDEWLDRYLQAFTRPDYGHAERCELFDLIIDIVNDRMRAAPQESLRIWDHVWPLMAPFFDAHRSQIEYWACLGNSLDDAFAVAGIMRKHMETK